MINSTSMQAYDDSHLISGLNKMPFYNQVCFQTLNNFHKTEKKHKKIISNLTALNFGLKNKPINNLAISSIKKSFYNVPTSNYNRKLFTEKKDKSSNIAKSFYASENVNVLNLATSAINYNFNSDIKQAQRIMNTENNYLTPVTKLSKENRVQNKFSDQNYVNKNLMGLFNNTNNSQLFSNINTSNDNINNNIPLENNNNNSLRNSIFLNIKPSYFNEDEPNKNNFKLTDYTIIKEIGKGAEGIIYNIRWNKNNKNYALKKSQIMHEINVKKKGDDNKALKNFIESTGCDGIIKPYVTIFKHNEIGSTDCYEIMELAEKDWETEILNRAKEKKYYSEYELMAIFRHLIKIFALLQKNHITHRDIKPTNIMLVNGKLKICDFGNARVLKRNGIIIQRIRGSELFMSPILFNAYRSRIQNIRHNAYRSDVFSLGICFFIAACLSYDGANCIRLMYDMNKIKRVLDYNLAKKYSSNIINLIFTMIQVEENKRPDFIDLESIFP